MGSERLGRASVGEEAALVFVVSHIPPDPPPTKDEAVTESTANTLNTRNV